MPPIFRPRGLAGPYLNFMFDVSMVKIGVRGGESVLINFRQVNFRAGHTGGHAHPTVIFFC